MSACFQSIAMASVSERLVSEELVVLLVTVLRFVSVLVHLWIQLALRVIMVALCNRADHYIFVLWFLSSSFFFFSSRNLSGRRLDVYYTSTYGVALVRISNACLKFTARCSLKIQDAKKRHFGTIAQLCRAVSSQLRHVSTIRKKLVKHRYLLHMSS